MKVVIQRSGASSVSVQQEVVGAISQGLVLLVCVEKGDTSETMLKAAQKIINIRMTIINFRYIESQYQSSEW